MTANPHAADPTAIRGAITPLVTPFAADGSLDLEAIPRHLEPGDRIDLHYLVGVVTSITKSSS